LIYAVGAFLLNQQLYVLEGLLVKHDVDVEKYGDKLFVESYI
jgi:hypothetical protein